MVRFAFIATLLGITPHADAVGWFVRHVKEWLAVW
jgi:hypothetical protein